jgi:hypothetical protein
VCAQNSIFSRQVFILEEQFLVDQAGHVGEQAYPFVLFHGHDTSPVQSAPSFLTVRAQSSQLVNCFSVGKALKSAPAPAITVALSEHRCP